jgi:lauroyl/myristoyl acyltransferase
MPGPALNMAEWAMGRFGAFVPVLGRTVAENIRAAGIDDPRAVRAYFRQTAEHAVNAVRGFQRGAAGPRLVEMAREQVAVDSTIERLTAAMARGRGALVATPHVCNYVLTLARLNLETPVCVSAMVERAKRELTRWCRRRGAGSGAMDATDRRAGRRRAGRRDQGAGITPDIAQRGTACR